MNNINIKRLFIKNLKLFYIIYIIMNGLNELNNFNELNELNNVNQSNQLNKDIIYEENTDVDSEEIEDELMEDMNLELEDSKPDKTFGLDMDLSKYCNMNTLFILLAVIALIYFVFKDKIHSLLNMNSSPNLCP
tara:strand:+ start:810 stop:1211 length:402 start_codon:yes stop_codon:yes gene_type:complete